MPAPEIFQTVRFDAMRLSDTHLSELSIMHMDPEVMLHLGGVRDEVVTRTYITDNADHWARFGYGTWALRDRAGIFAGRCALRHITIDDVDEVELGYSLVRDFWGQGLATEIAAALVDIGFRQCGLSNIIAFADVGHAASFHVMEKVGFVFEKERDIKGAFCAVYRIYT